MSNPLFNLMGNQMNLGNMGNIGNLLQQFQQFKSTFSGDPREQVQQLLNSGKVTQNQYNNAVQMAQAFKKMLG